MVWAGCSSRSCETMAGEARVSRNRALQRCPAGAGVSCLNPSTRDRRDLSPGWARRYRGADGLLLLFLEGPPPRPPPRRGGPPPPPPPRLAAPPPPPPPPPGAFRRFSLSSSPPRRAPPPPPPPPASPPSLPFLYFCAVLGPLAPPEEHTHSLASKRWRTPPSPTVFPPPGAGTPDAQVC